MTYNAEKLVVAGVLALSLIVAVIIDSNSATWAVPILTLLVGYVVGNAAVTSQEGKVAPIIKRLPPPTEDTPESP